MEYADHTEDIEVGHDHLLRCLAQKGREGRLEDGNAGNDIHVERGRPQISLPQSREVSYDLAGVRIRIGPIKVQDSVDDEDEIKHNVGVHQRLRRAVSRHDEYPYRGDERIVPNHNKDEDVPCQADP